MSLANRIINEEGSGNLFVKSDPDYPDRILYYRSVKLSESAFSDNPFERGAYGEAIAPPGKGTVLEFKEDDGESVLWVTKNYVPSFRLHICRNKKMTEIRFSANSGLNYSRVMIEDPHKRIYYLKTDGTLSDNDTWYLPEKITFSQNAMDQEWHIKLDQYACLVYDYKIVNM